MDKFCWQQHITKGCNRKHWYAGGYTFGTHFGFLAKFGKDTLASPTESTG